MKATDRYALVCGDALEFVKGLPSNSVDVAFTSPPYSDCRTYGVGAARNSAAWVKWLRPIVREMCRVSKGLVFLNVSDSVKACVYQNGPEWLHADLTRLDGLAACRPYAWVKSGPDFDDRGNGTPGSGAHHFHRNDWEPIYGYALPEKLPPHWSDSTAFGSPPVYGDPGGEFSTRSKNGTRANDPWKTAERGGGAGGRFKNGEKKTGVKTKHTKRMPDGEMREQYYAPPLLSNPGNVIRARVGGGHLGSPLAHHGEAPMPLGVAERFVCWFCPPDGKVLDPFLGSGTTAHAAIFHGRNFIGCDIRQSQIDLTRRRLESVTPSLLTLPTDPEPTEKPVPLDLFA